jgi:hypothetical protein
MTALHPAVTIAIGVGVFAAAFWLVLALVDRLQKRKAKNSPRLEPGPDEGQNLDGPGE